MITQCDVYEFLLARTKAFCSKLCFHVGELSDSWECDGTANYCMCGLRKCNGKLFEVAAMAS